MKPKRDKDGNLINKNKVCIFTTGKKIIIGLYGDDDGVKILSEYLYLKPKSKKVKFIIPKIVKLNNTPPPTFKLPKELKENQDIFYFIQPDWLVRKYFKKIKKIYKSIKYIGDYYTREEINNELFKDYI